MNLAKNIDFFVFLWYNENVSTYQKRGKWGWFPHVNNLTPKENPMRNLAHFFLVWGAIILATLMGYAIVLAILEFHAVIAWLYEHIKPIAGITGGTFITTVLFFTTRKEK